MERGRERVRKERERREREERERRERGGREERERRERGERRERKEREREKRVRSYIQKGHPCVVCLCGRLGVYIFDLLIYFRRQETPRL